MGHPKNTLYTIKMDQWDESGGANTAGALSTSHSTDTALPAISLNSAPGSGDRMRVAMVDTSAMNILSKKMLVTHDQIRHLDFGNSSG
jgi:hypothetical protein